MPQWLIPIIKLAIQIGSPYLLKLINGLVGSLAPEVQALIQEFIDSLLNPKMSNSSAKKVAKAKLNAYKESLRQSPGPGDLKA